MKMYLTRTVLLAFLSATTVTAFTTPTATNIHKVSYLQAAATENNNDDDAESTPNHNMIPTRRDAIQKAVLAVSTTAATSSTFLSNANAIDIPFFSDTTTNAASSSSSSYGTVYQQAKRSTAYLVDSTIPPTLVPYRASREAAILKDLGNGLGTAKSPFIEEEINLNNMLNKGVFGTVDLIQNALPSSSSSSSTSTDVVDNEEMTKKGSKKKGYDSTFVFLGMDYDTPTSSSTTGQPQDVNLAISVMTDIFKPARGVDTTIALDFAPLSTQPALDAYISSSSSLSEQGLIEALAKAQVPQYIITQQLPILQYAKSKSIQLLACAPEPQDVQLVRKEGLQNINPETRATNYVLDANGFIEWTQNEKNKLYTEYSLLKDFTPESETDGPGDYFAERILVHETIATTLAKHSLSRGDSKKLIVALSPIRDVRYFGGPNGRLPRIIKYLNPDTNVNEEAVTTILLNPTARNTLSKSKFLRLEIGTAPKNVRYQTKVADYLWFSEMPKVNMLPRLMNGY